MTIKDLLTRAQDRWQHKPITLPQVELITEDRLHTPAVGERICKDPWNINHGAVAG